jgi:hypothetical protein
MDTDLSRFYWKVDPVSYPQVGDTEVQLRVKNETGHDFSGKLTLIITSDSGKAPKYQRPVSLKAGAEQIVSFKHSVSAPERDARYKISLTDETGKLSYLGDIKKQKVLGADKVVKAPPGLFKDLNDEIVGDAIIINGKQLFIDDYIIEELKGAEKVLNQPVKHPRNPLLVRDKPWELDDPDYSTVIYDQAEGIFKMWYTMHVPDRKVDSEQVLGYATSKDGLRWTKPIINKKNKTNIVFHSKIPGFLAPGIFKDPVARDPQKRYKMLFSACQDGTAKTLSTNAAYSPDGIHWTDEPTNPVVPFSDTQSCPFWDARRGRYVAHLRYGPPNSRICSVMESEDFVHWSPKVTIFRQTKMDYPFGTKHYAMQVMQYGGVYIGFLWAYHGETTRPIPPDKLWMDKTNLQLAFSRNGRTWLRVAKDGAIPWRKINDNRDWKKATQEAVFIPYGRHKKDWDWGCVGACHQPLLVVDDQIRIYYRGYTGRHWAKYHGDKVPKTRGIGLATLRLDGFVSINAADAGTMTTKKFVFIGDTLEVNADAKGGSIRVEALDAKGKVVEGFSKTDCIPITTDSVRHVLKWKGQKDCHLIQARPIRLRFHLKKAKLYSFIPRIRHKHYVQSYE